MIKVELKGVDKSYSSGKPVLHKLDLTVNPGELFFLLGPSGCGKSTLLRILAGFLQPDNGTVEFDGKDVTRLAPEKRDAGMVFQNYALWPHMTIFDNVAFGLDTRKIKGEARTRQVMEALEMVKMTEFSDRKPASLSGGQQQRVALARAIAFRPRLLLLDEPLSNLDAKLRDTMRCEIRRICKSAGLTGIYVTHDRKEALSMGDRIAVVHQGRLEQIGSPERLYRSPSTRFTAEFMGHANFLKAEVVEISERFCDIETTLGRMKVLRPEFTVTPGSAVTAMVRPECIGFNGTGNCNSFNAEIIEGSFLGETGIWELKAADERFTAYELCPPIRSAGSKVKITIAPENIILMEDK